MRFWSVFVFMLCLNLAAVMIQATGIFPGMAAVGVNGNGWIDLNATANAANTNISSAASGNDVNGFFAFIFGIITAFQMFIALVGNVLFGFPNMLYWVFNCTSGTCPGYVKLFIDGMSALIGILYVLAIIQIIGSRYIENS